MSKSTRTTSVALLALAIAACSRPPADTPTGGTTQTPVQPAALNFEAELLLYTKKLVASGPRILKVGPDGIEYAVNEEGQCDPPVPPEPNWSDAVARENAFQAAKYIAEKRAANEPPVMVTKISPPCMPARSSAAISSDTEAQ